MLDLLDFKVIADEYCQEYKTVLSSNEVYICVWALLKPNSVTPNAPKEELQDISDFLLTKGYYAKNGGRPKNIGAPLPIERRPV
jgi:hypothetical protein